MRMKEFLSKYGSALVLLGLCIYYSVSTLKEEFPNTPDAGREVADAILANSQQSPAVLVVAGNTKADNDFTSALEERLLEHNANVIAEINADTPAEARFAIEATSGNRVIDAIATNDAGSRWGFLRPEGLGKLAENNPGLANVLVYKPGSVTWPVFLKRENLINVLNRNAEVAIVAIGMTMVIITAGIDLGVGSIMALCGVASAVTIQLYLGGADAGTSGVIGGCLLGLGLAAMCGVFTGLMVTTYGVPAFVVTLSLMMAARGFAMIMAVNYQAILAGGANRGTPEAVGVDAPAFALLAQGDFLGLPNPIWLTIVLYVIAHVVMTRTSLGRYIYAVGGNPEAARLSGVPVFGVLIFVYAMCSLLAGAAGLIDAARFSAARPDAGDVFELRVIAAVVVGGTSLAGGQGRITGTLIGVLIIGVIQNGLNLANVPTFEQKPIYGMLILAAVVLDRIKTLAVNQKHPIVWGMLHFTVVFSVLGIGVAALTPMPILMAAVMASPYLLVGVGLPVFCFGLAGIKDERILFWRDLQGTQAKVAGGLILLSGVGVILVSVAMGLGSLVKIVTMLFG